MPLLPIVCSANVENGSDAVEVTGTDASTGSAVVLTNLNCRPNATLFLAGIGYMVKARTDTTHLQLERVYEGADATGVSCSIAPFTPEMANRAELATSLRDYSARRTLLEARGNGLHYIALGATGLGDPGPGNVSYVGASWAAATGLCIDVLDAVGRDRTSLIDRWALGDTLIVESIATAAYVAYQLTQAPTNEGPDAWRGLEEFAYLGGDGALVDDEDLRLVWIPGGEPGPGYEYDQEVDTPDDLAAFEGTATDGLRVWVDDLGPTEFGAHTAQSGVVSWNAGTSSWILRAVFTGPKGDQGEKGWSPQLVVVADGERQVFKLLGYVGGVGTAPAANVGEYLKADGTFTATTGDAADIRGLGFNWQGAYSGATTYAKRDVVRDQNASWVALQATTGNAPPTLPTTSNAYWDLMAPPGANGAGTVASVVSGTGITVDATDPANPSVGLSSATQATIASKITMGKAIAAALII